MEPKDVTEISVASDYSPYPAGRYPTDGAFNGQNFRDKVLLPLLKEAKVVRVNIDGVALLPSSFWEEVWGGMIRESRISKEDALARFEITTSEDDLATYVDMAWRFLNDAKPKAA